MAIKYPFNRFNRHPDTAAEMQRSREMTLTGKPSPPPSGLTNAAFIPALAGPLLPSPSMRYFPALRVPGSFNARLLQLEGERSELGFRRQGMPESVRMAVDAPVAPRIDFTAVERFCLDCPRNGRDKSVSNEQSKPRLIVTCLTRKSDQ